MTVPVKIPRKKSARDTFSVRENQYQAGKMSVQTKAQIPPFDAAKHNQRLNQFMSKGTVNLSKVKPKQNQ